MIHLYALVREAPTASLRGIDDRPVSTVAVGDLHAVISAHPAPVRASEAAALAHAFVIERVAEHVEALPVRFGADHEDEGRLAARLEPELPGLRAALDRVGGKVEFVVRPAASAPIAPDPDDRSPSSAADEGPGRAYLEQRQAVLRSVAARQCEAREQLRAATEPLAPAATEVRDISARQGPERCFLVARDDAARFVLRAREALGDSGDHVLGGPWPPFTFASLPTDEEVAP